jgi:hypothetical protein
MSTGPKGMYIVQRKLIPDGGGEFTRKWIWRIWISEVPFAIQRIAGQIKAGFIRKNWEIIEGQVS